MTYAIVESVLVMRRFTLETPLYKLVFATERDRVRVIKVMIMYIQYVVVLTGKCSCVKNVYFYCCLWNMIVMITMMSTRNTRSVQNTCKKELDEQVWVNLRLQSRHDVNFIPNMFSLSGGTVTILCLCSRVFLMLWHFLMII